MRASGSESLLDWDRSIRIVQSWHTEEDGVWSLKKGVTSRWLSSDRTLARKCPASWLLSLLPVPFLMADLETHLFLIAWEDEPLTCTISTWAQVCLWELHGKWYMNLGLYVFLCRAIPTSQSTASARRDCSTWAQGVRFTLLSYFPWLQV
jgi:hypothetical protein